MLTTARKIGLSRFFATIDSDFLQKLFTIDVILRSPKKSKAILNLEQPSCFWSISSFTLYLCGSDNAAWVSSEV
jgi:hypothetical protein